MLMALTNLFARGENFSPFYARNMMKKYCNNHVHSIIHLVHRQTVLLRRVVEEIFARWSIVCVWSNYHCCVVFSSFGVKSQNHQTSYYGKAHALLRSLSSGKMYDKHSIRFHGMIFYGEKKVGKSAAASVLLQLGKDIKLRISESLMRYQEYLQGLSGTFFITMHKASRRPKSRIHSGHSIQLEVM